MATLSETQLIAFINETVNKWALEEYQANGPEIPFADRHAENMEIYYWSTMPDGKKIVNQEAKQMLHELSWKLVNITRNE